MAAESRGVETVQPTFGRIYSRFLILSVLTVGLLGLLGYAATVNLAGASATSSMWVALLVAWVASLLGTVPIWLARNKSPLQAFPAQMGAMAVRLVAILLLGAAIALGGWIETKPFLIWLVIGHIGLLVTDTMLARSMVLRISERETEGALEEQ